MAKKLSKKSLDDIDRQLKEIKESAGMQNVSAQQTVLQNTQKQDVETRQQIAKLYVIVYFVILFLIIAGIPLYNLWSYSVTNDPTLLQISLSDTIQTYSAVVGPTLGFVVAYYFKSSKND